MKYTTYLQSEHWRLFRERIFKTRKICQGCEKRNRLTIHHKNYKCLGKESPDDVLVLCWDCHNRFHKKKKWIKKYKNGEDLDFTSSKNRDNLLFKRSSVLRVCTRCAKSHPIFYMRFRNLQLVPAIACPDSKPRVIFLPQENGLDIPIFNSKALQKYGHS